MPRSAMSLQPHHDPKNEAEVTYWNSAGGRYWVEREQRPGSDPADRAGAIYSRCEQLTKFSCIEARWGDWSCDRVMAATYKERADASRGEV